MDGPPGWELVEAPLQEVGSWRDLPDGPPGWELVDAPFQKVGSWRDLPDDVLAVRSPRKTPSACTAASVQSSRGQVSAACNCVTLAIVVLCFWGKSPAGTR